MAVVYGIGFFVIFLIELILTIVWIRKFKLYECYKPNTVSFHFYARWFLCLLPLMSGTDNLRLFIGSFVTESFASSNFWKNYFLFVCFLHFVLLSLLTIVCAVFITTPKTEAIDISLNPTNDHEYMDDMIYNQSSKYNSCIWFFAYFLTFLLFVIGMYSFVTFCEHTSFDRKYTIYKWSIDEDYIKHDLNFIQVIGLQQPVFVSVFTLIMNIIIWKGYKYYVPFVITLLSIIGMVVLVASTEIGFFFVGNFFEFTLFVSFYKLDVFMYWLEEERQSSGEYYTSNAAQMQQNQDL